MIIKNKMTKILLGILWGFGLAVIFRQACLGKNCIILKAPKPSLLKGHIYGFDDKCYTYKPKSTTCTKDTVTI